MIEGDSIAEVETIEQPEPISVVLDQKRNKVMPDRYWHDPANVEAELTKIIGSIGYFPTANELRTTLQQSTLVDGVMRTGGFRKWQQELGFESKATVPGYWSEVRIAADLAKLTSDLGHFPTDTELRDQNPKVRDAVSRNGGITFWREKMGLSPIRKAVNYWKDVENIESEARDVLDIGINLSEADLRENGYSSLSMAIHKYYPGGMPAVKQKLGLEETRKANNYWTQEKILSEAQDFVIKKKNLSRQVLIDAERGDLYNAAIESYPGGINGLRTDLGLSPLRVNKPEGYWTDELIEQQAKDFLKDNGVLTTYAIAQSGMSDLASAISSKYSGGINGLRKKLDLEVREEARPANYWKKLENIEKEALVALDAVNDLTTTNLVNSGYSSLVYAAYEYYPGGIVALREKLGLKGIIKQPDGYWDKIENIEFEASNALSKGIELKKTSLGKAGYSSLAAAITRRYPNRWEGINAKIKGNTVEHIFSPDKADEMMRGLQVE